MTVESGSLCPTVKAANIIGDKWVMLILRELFLGTSRYNDFQRALPRISPTILSKRLKHLEAQGLIIKRTAAGQKSTEYRLTTCGREIFPVIDEMAKWGFRWARRKLSEEDMEVGSFMWDFHRALIVDELPDGEIVLCMTFSDQKKNKTWWMIINGNEVDLCTEDPGKNVDLYLTGSLEQIAEIFMGDVKVSTAVKNETLTPVGDAHLIRTISLWFPKAMYADVRPERFLEVS